VTVDSAPPSWRDAVVELVETGHLTGPFDLGRLVADALQRTGATAVVYLVDYEQRGLRPLPPGEGGPEDVDGGAAGRAFTTLRPTPLDPPESGWWVPVVNGTERLGLLRVAAPPDTQAGTLAGSRLVAGMVGHLLTAKTQYGDDIERVRRSRPMSPAAELLRGLLPPLTFSGRQLVVSAVLEPCYEVGGDAFDYAVDHRTARIGVFDGVGKGMRAALAIGAAFGAIRAARRAGGGLEASAVAADAELIREFPDARFVTALLAELDLGEGRLRYLNAGHPPPVLIRGGRVVGRLAGGARTPLGVESQPVEIAEEKFEPGDRLLLYTDGITEARDPSGALFGLDRLIDLAEQVSAADLPAAEIVRRLSHAALAHQAGPPRDDATLMLVEWSPEAARRSVP
jgi:hypothetical protein